MQIAAANLIFSLPVLKLFASDSFRFAFGRKVSGLVYPEPLGGPLEAFFSRGAPTFRGFKDRGHSEWCSWPGNLETEANSEVLPWRKGVEGLP